MRILIIGGTGGTTIGSSLRRAAEKNAFHATYLDAALAFEANPIVRRIWWHLLQRRPYRLREFSRRVLQTALAHRVEVLLTTGLAPVDAEALKTLGARGVRRVNYLTDDPWNPAHRAPSFLRALPHYDAVFTPRRTNMVDLERAGCRHVAFLPFGYDEDLWYPDSHNGETADVASDVYFAGGADADRVPYITALVSAGLNVRLHGSYWDRYPETRGLSRGQAGPEEVRRALSAAKLGLCLVRRANRDGNSMRTFEVPATGTCVLAEDTAEHREIFGDDGAGAVYFTSVGEMVEKARHLVSNNRKRERIARLGYEIVTRGGHTYRDRLEAMCRAVLG